MGAKAPVSQRDPAAAGVKVSQSSFGIAIPVIYGRCRVPANLIWIGHRPNNFYAGHNDFGWTIYSGFGGAAAPSGNNFYYYASMMWGLGEGPIEGVRTIYKRETRYVLTRFNERDAEGVIHELNLPNTRVFPGVPGQPAWDVSIGPTTLTFTLGNDTLYWPNVQFLAPSPELRYPFFAYLARHGWPLYQRAELPNLTFEVFGLKLEPTVRDIVLGGDPNFPAETLTIGANPADIIEDMFTDPIHGIGFPTDMLGDLSEYRTASHANGWFLSMPCTEQRPIREYIQQLLDQSNATVRFSAGKLQFISLHDQRVTGPIRLNEPPSLTQTQTFTPSWLTKDAYGEYTTVSVPYRLTEADFLAAEGEEAIDITRPNPADAFNAHTVEYFDRHKNYAATPVDTHDLAAIQLYGRRDAALFEAHAITDPQSAQQLAEIRKQRAVMVLNNYKFHVDWRYVRLDAGDLLLLNHARYHLVDVLVRIISIQESDDDETLTIEAEDFVIGLASTVIYPRQESVAQAPDLTAPPGSINEPVIFEPLAALGNADLEVWIALNGQSRHWGGCTVWLSEDGGVEYRPVGQVTRRATMGKLQSALTVGGTTVDVLLGPSELTMELRPFTIDEVIRFTSACYIDAGDAGKVPYEIISYALPTLTAPNRYDLAALRRAGFGSTAQNHKKGANFVFLDEAVLRLPLPPRLLNPTQYLPLRFKFTSFNIFGGEEEALEDVHEVIYRLQGTYLRTPVAAIQNLQVQFIAAENSGRVMLTWTPVQDLRGVVEYEVRRGADGWERAVILGTTREAQFPVSADGAYWIATRVSVTAFDPPRYLYGAPASVVVKETVDLVENVVQSYDELPLQWSSYADQVKADLAVATEGVWFRLGSYPTYPNVYDAISGTAMGVYVLTSPTTQLLTRGGVAFDVGLDDAAVEFAGDNDLVILPPDARNDLSGNEWSLHFLVKCTDYSSQRFLYAKATGSWLTIESTGKLRWLSAVSGSQLDGQTVLDTNWHSVLVTFRRYATDGTEERRLRIFLDGMPEASMTGATFPATTGNTWIGNKGSAAIGFRGRIDEFVKLSTALNPHRAKSWYATARSYEAGIFSHFVMQASPDVYLRFSEASQFTAVDSWVSKFHAQFGAVPTLVPGLIGGDPNQARYFDGTGTTYLKMDRDLFSPGDKIAMEATFKADNKVDQYLMGYHLVGALNDGPHIRLGADGSITADFVDTSGTSHTLTANLAYNAGQIVHVVAVLDGIFAALHVNGVLAAATVFAPMTLRTGGRDFYVAQTPFVSHASFAGVVDEVVLYYPPLSPERPKVHANAVLSGQGITGLEVDPVTFYLRALPNTTGYFQVPDAHIVTLARRMVVNVAAGWDAGAIGPLSIRDEPNFQAIGQVNVLDAARLIVCEPEISISDDATGNDWTGNATRPEWMPFRPGGYLARRIRLRIKLGSLAAGLIAVLRAFTWGVDVPDLLQRAIKTTSVNGTVPVTYLKPFHVTPGLVVSMQNATGTQAEVIRVTSETPTGFNVDVVNTAGQRLVRELSWIAQGY